MNQSIIPFLTVVSWLAYRFLRRQIRWFCIPISLRIFYTLLWSTYQSFLIVNEAEVYIFWNSLVFLLCINRYCQFGSFAFTKSSFYIWKLLEVPQLTKNNNLENDFDTYLQPYSDFANFRCVHVQTFSFMQIYHILVHMTTNIVNMQTIPSLSSLLLLFYNHTYLSSFWAFLVAQTVNSSNLFSLSRTLPFQTVI